MQSIHGKELLNLVSLFTMKDLQGPSDDKGRAQNIKDISQKHFGVAPQVFAEASDEQVVTALYKAQDSRDGSRRDAQRGMLMTGLGIASIATGIFAGGGFALAMFGLRDLHSARKLEQRSHEQMNNGIKKLAVPMPPS